LREIPRQEPGHGSWGRLLRAAFAVSLKIMPPVPRREHPTSAELNVPKVVCTFGWLLRGGFQDGGGAVEGFGEDSQLGLGARGVGGFDGFVDAGDDYSSVAGELARSIDGVLIPGAPGESGGIEEGFLGGP
jgi:hypothetical protein